MAVVVEDKLEYTWEVRDFCQLSGKVYSEEFEVGLYSWRLACFPKQNVAPRRYVSVFLECVTKVTDDGGPTATATITIRNHLDAVKDYKKFMTFTYKPDTPDWGFSEMVPRTDATVEAGYLRYDGVLVIHVDMSVQAKRDSPALRSIGNDLLSLLGPTGSAFSDVTILAGDRSFPAHRNILAARCPYFATLFGSGFADSATRECSLAEADADAFDLLLHFIYSGTLRLQNLSRRVLRHALDLADRLQLTEAHASLHALFMDTCSCRWLVEDLLWAAGRDNTAELQERLEAFYAEHAEQLRDEDVEVLAVSNPRLMVKLQRAALAAASKMKE